MEMQSFNVVLPAALAATFVVSSFSNALADSPPAPASALHSSTKTCARIGPVTVTSYMGRWPYRGSGDIGRMFETSMSIFNSQNHGSPPLALTLFSIPCLSILPLLVRLQQLLQQSLENCATAATTTLDQRGFSHSSPCMSPSTPLHVPTPPPTIYRKEGKLLQHSLKFNLGGHDLCNGVEIRKLTIFVQLLLAREVEDNTHV